MSRLYNDSDMVLFLYVGYRSLIISANYKEDINEFFPIDAQRDKFSIFEHLSKVP